MILHSPTERGSVISALTRLAADRGVPVASSSVPERYGVDFAWHDAHGDWRGVQRKELHDFLASVEDGRLTKEVAQMNASIVMPVLAFEGRLQLTDGALGSTVLTRGRGPTVSYGTLNKQLLTLAHHGIQVMFTSEPTQTAELILAYFEWSQAAHHSTATTRPKPANDWGSLSNRDFQIHLLTSLDGVGAKTAADIVDTLGRCPLRVDATVEELCTVPGIGQVTARKIVYSINGSPHESTKPKRGRRGAK